MSVTKLPSGRWRAQVYHQGRNVSAGTWATKREAKAAREAKRRELQQGPRSSTTVKEFRSRWTTDPLFARPKQSTNIHNAERTRAFTDAYGNREMASIGDDIVHEWLREPRRTGTIPALRAMWNDAASAKAGRIVDRNPWTKLGISRGTGNRHKQPPSEEQVWAIIHDARSIAGPHLAAWLQVAAFTGMRPGELDALRWHHIDFATENIRVAEQWNAGSRDFTAPKNGQARNAPLTAPAREALIALPRTTPFCFINFHGEHFTPSSRAYHWKAIKAAAGWNDTLYLATRHFAGWYMVNVLELASEDVAIALGHSDGGELVRRLYGHRDHARALDRVRAAYAATGNVTPLTIVKDTG
jgi:integrase